MKFRKKPVVIEAIQFNGFGIDDNWTSEERAVFMKGAEIYRDNNDLIIHTREGDMRASVGDWIIKGIAGEFYPCKPDIFEKTYEALVPSEE